MNLHIHSRFSDGDLDVESILKYAERLGVNLIGITDHYKTSKLPDQLQVTNLKKYIEVLKEIKNKSKKVRLLIGLEIDCGRMGISIEEWEFDLINQLDFVLLEYIQDVNWGGKILEKVIEEINNRITIPIGLAHNNLVTNFNLNTQKKCDKLCNFLENNNIFVELNEGESESNFIDGKYYFELFSHNLIQSLKKSKIRFTIGTDSHHQYFLNKTKKAFDFIKINDLIMLNFDK